MCKNYFYNIKIKMFITFKFINIYKSKMTIMYIVLRNINQNIKI